MGSQTIYHKSKVADIVMNFAASENNLSWSFTAENDGEIYEDAKTNVASYTINGGAVTLPFALVGGSSYSVAITKTTNGQTASISLKTRRSIDKTVNISVPDFGAYTGRYLYVLLNNNTIKKFDSQLLLPSNYAGAGVWTVDPVVATITLPTLPNSGTYSRIKFVKVGGVEKMFISGQAYTTSTTFYASYLLLSNDTVYDLSLVNANSYTSLIALVGINYSNGRQANAQYDFINEFLYIKSASGGSGNTVIKVNLTNNTAINLGYSSFADGQITSYEHQFSPIDLQFIAIGDYSVENSRNYNYKFYSNNGGVFGYNYRNNQRICTGATFGVVNYFNNAGAYIGNVSYGVIGVYGCTEIYGFDRANTVFMTYIDSYSIVNRNTSTAKYRTTDKELASPNNYLLNLRNCHYSDIYVALCGTSARVPSTRMIVFKESETNADFGYYDFATAVYSADSNQLLI